MDFDFFFLNFTTQEIYDLYDCGWRVQDVIIKDNTDEKDSIKKSTHFVKLGL